MIHGLTTIQNVNDKSLSVPKKQEFALSNIQMNMSKQAVEKLGHPKRMTSNEYGTKWYTYYNKYYDNFIMISYIKNHVNACTQIKILYLQNLKLSTLLLNIL